MLQQKSENGKASYAKPKKDYSHEAVASRALGMAAYFLKNDRALAKETIEQRDFELDNAYKTASGKIARKKLDLDNAYAAKDLGRVNALKKEIRELRNEEWDRMNALRDEIKKLKKIADRW